MTEDRDVYGAFDPDEEFVLSANDVRMLLSYIDGDSHVVDDEDFNSLLTDMQEFINDEDYDDEELD